LAERINAGSFGVTAAIINDGSKGSPYRLSVSAAKTGSAGAFIFDDGALGLSPTTLNEAQDSIVFFGGSDPSKSLLVTATTNTLTDVIPGATIDLLSRSDEVVQVTISEDDNSIVENVRGFVNAFNSVVDTINKFDTFNAETEQRGLLLGDSALVTIRNELFRMVSSAASGISSQFRTLSAVGVRVGTGARLQLDETKLREALRNDRDAVQSLFTLTEEEEDDDGETVTTSVGLGVRLRDLINRLTDSDFGPIQGRIDALNRQVELNDDRIETLDQRLEAKRARLEAEFAAMERALSNLQAQNSALSAFQPILQTARNNANQNNS
jgi:flagellar hook-associated protein 2